MANITEQIATPPPTLLNIEDYCNQYNVNDMYSFIYTKSFSGEIPKSKENWDIFLQNRK